jgi:hypothetical protein
MDKISFIDTAILPNILSFAMLQIIFPHPDVRVAISCPQHPHSMNFIVTKFAFVDATIRPGILPSTILHAIGPLA